MYVYSDFDEAFVRARVEQFSQQVARRLDGSLTEAWFYRLLRARRDFPRYQRELFARAVARGHHLLARRLAERILAQGDNRAIRLGLAALSATPEGAARRTA